MPMAAECEHPEQTSNLCLRLFPALGVEGVSIQDFDTVHQVLSMKPSNRPNAIVRKFVRRLAKDQVMVARKKGGGLKGETELGFAADINVKYLSYIYDHLTPRLQALYYEAKKVKEAIRTTFSTALEAEVNDHLQS